MKKMKNVLNKMLAALVIAASMTSLCAPAYAEEAPADPVEAYTVTEDEQGTVTIVFNEPIVLSREESYAGSEAEKDDGIMPCGDRWFLYIPEEFWGTYTSTAGSYTLTIQEKNSITFDGYCNNMHVYCDSSKVESVKFYPERNMSNGLVVTYSSFEYVSSSGQHEQRNYSFNLNGWYEKEGGYFVIASINYHLDKQ